MMLLYKLNEIKKAAMLPANKLAKTAEFFLNLSASGDEFSNAFKASNEMFKRITSIKTKPKFDINLVSCNLNGEKIETKVDELIIFEKSFCQLKHFKKHKEINQPKMLIVAPLSGHFATLLKDTVLKCLEDFDVYVTDWADSRFVPLKEGDFSLDDYVDYLLDFMRFIGGNINVLAVCQPAVPVLIATALLEEYKEPCIPNAIILMGGPIDTRINPGQVDEFAKEHSFSWFENNIISIVPAYYPGGGRKVCPGFVMLNGFMFLNLERHQTAAWNFFQNLIKGDEDKVEKHKKFYDEYLSVMDVPGTYFLDSIKHVFQEHSLPLGTMKWRGNLIKTQAITKTKIFTVEGELDDISCPGQTEAVHNMCNNLAEKNKGHYLQKGVGHYGIFNGSKWRNEIYPRIFKFCN